MGHVLATAHDMAREYRIIKALAGSNVPVPSVVGLCEDDQITGAPFYVMDFVPGLVVRTVEDATLVPLDVRRRMGTALVEVLARLHDVDLETVGLSDLGRHDGYVERQLKRWRIQFERSTTRDLPQVLAVGGEVAAVLDWELCTTGDVLADVAGMVAYADSRATGGQLPPTSIEGFPSADEVRSLYEAHGTRDLAELDYYLAFAYWRIACIVEGVYSRYAAGVMGDQDDPRLVEAFGQRVVDLADLAYEMASRLPTGA